MLIYVCPVCPWTPPKLLGRSKWNLVRKLTLRPATKLTIFDLDLRPFDFVEANFERTHIHTHMYVSMNSSETARSIGMKLSEVVGLEASYKINWFWPRSEAVWPLRSPKYCLVSLVGSVHKIRASFIKILTFSQNSWHPHTFAIFKQILTSS